MRVAIYARVSTDEQKQGRTIDSQIGALLNYAESKSFTVIEKYVDDGWSGALLNRPALDRMRDEAGKRLFEAVLITDVDRLGRDVANLAVVKRDLEGKGVNLIFQRLPTDGGPLGNFMVNILGSFAEFERALIADRTRRGRRFKVQERHLIMGNLPPYGYRYVKKDKLQGVEGHYVVNPEEARTVRMMYRWVAEEGLSQRGTTKRLNDLGLPPRQGRVWARSSVHRVLTNETYAGITYYDKHRAVPARTKVTHDRLYQADEQRRQRPRDEWIPIPLPSHLHLVDRRTYELVQDRLLRNKRLASTNVKYVYLLREVRKVCGQCGAAYVGTPYHGRPFYRCSKRDGTVPVGGRCRASIVSARKLEALVWSSVQDAVMNPTLILDQVNSLHDRRATDLSSKEREIDDLEKQLAALAIEEVRVLAAYRTGVTTLDQFGKELANITTRRAAVTQLLEQARQAAPRPVPAQLTQDIHYWSRAIRKEMKRFDDGARQRFLGLLLSEIVISREQVRVRGEIPSPSINVDALPMKGYGCGRRGSVREPASTAASTGPKSEDFARRDGHRGSRPFELVLTLPPAGIPVTEDVDQQAA